MNSSRQLFSGGAVFAAALLLTLSVSASPGNRGTTMPLNPKLDDRLSVTAGYSIDLRQGARDQAYYRVEFNGKQVTADGAAPTPTNVTSPFDPPTAAPSPDGKTDTKSFSLELKQFNSSRSGSIFDILGVKENPLGKGRGLPFQLRGATQITGTTNLDNLNLAVGVERKPLPFFSFVNKIDKGWTNYFIPGVFGEKQLRNTGGGENESSMLCTYRAYLGKGFQWVKSDQLKEEEAKAKEKVIQELNTPAKAKAYIDAHRGQNLNFVDGFIVNFYALNKNDPDAVWESKLRPRFNDYTTLDFDQPSYYVTFESAGYYRFTGGTGKKASNLFAAESRYWLNPDAEANRYLSLRYEFGRERADSSIKRNVVMISGGLVF